MRPTHFFSLPPPSLSLATALTLYNKVSGDAIIPTSIQRAPTPKKKKRKYMLEFQVNLKSPRIPQVTCIVERTERGEVDNEEGSWESGLKGGRIQTAQCFRCSHQNMVFTLHGLAIYVQENPSETNLWELFSLLCTTCRVFIADSVPPCDISHCLYLSYWVSVFSYQPYILRSCLFKNENGVINISWHLHHVLEVSVCVQGVEQRLSAFTDEYP